MVVLNGHQEPSLAKGDCRHRVTALGVEDPAHHVLHQHLAIGGRKQVEHSLAERQSGKKTMCSGFLRREIIVVLTGSFLRFDT